MPAETTTVIRPLTDQEKYDISLEIQRVDPTFWIRHVLPHQAHYTALYEGRTIHLNWSNQDLPNRQEFFPKTMNIIEKIINGHQLGRCYIHKILPQCKIRRHNDSVPVAQLKINRRYQIYLDIPHNVEMLLDDKLVPNPGYYQWSLVDFALTQPHSYKNHSDQDWIFIVFDEIMS